MAARKKPESVCERLRRAIRESGKTHYRIGMDARVKPEMVARFVRGERDIRGATLDRLAAALGLELCQRAEKT